ncbi:MAG TPA: hypothetical protein VEF72_00960 [Mycobacterium sp.]|nr:hypothetical protein [Mycobacterium sp.]
MRTTREKLIGLALGVAAAATTSGGLLAVPTAHAGANCMVPGPYLDLHQSTGYFVTVDASGASLGPTALVRTPQQTSPGNVTGGINGRSVDFTINWSGTKAYVHFTGTVGNDGVAHGTSTGTGTPVELDPGSWDSTTRLTC